MCSNNVRGSNICPGPNVCQVVQCGPMNVRGSNICPGPNVCQGAQCMLGVKAQGQDQRTCIRDHMYACAYTHKSLRP